MIFINTNTNSFNYSEKRKGKENIIYEMNEKKKINLYDRSKWIQLNRGVRKLNVMFV